MTDMSRIKETDLSLDDFETIDYYPECGGIGIFIGTVRNHHEGRSVKALKYTAYKPIAEKMIREIEQEIKSKYGVSYIQVIHRIGSLDIGGKAIIAVAYAPHRKEAFMACEEAVERVKHEVPVWKEEFYSDGTSEYVAGCCIRTDEDGVSHNHHHSSSKSHSH